MKFYSLKGQDTTFYPVRFVEKGLADTAIRVDFHPAAPIVYLKLNSSDTDTLSVEYKETQTKCCGNITEISKIQINNGVNLLPSYEPVEIKK